MPGAGGGARWTGGTGLNGGTLINTENEGFRRVKGVSARARRRNFRVRVVEQYRIYTRAGSIGNTSGR